MNTIKYTIVCEEELCKLKTDELNRTAMNHVLARLDAIAKPIDGLGRFEKMLIQIAGIQGNVDISADKKAILVMCADNGIVAEGVTQTSDEVTAIVCANMASGRCAVNHMAAAAGVDVLVTDIGVRCEVNCGGVRKRKIRRGTANFAVESAMTGEEAVTAVAEGIAWVGECRKQGYTILGVGEMGIGNTTTATAVSCAILGLSPDEMTGRGAGLDDVGLMHKRAVIRQAIDRYDLYHADAMTILRTVGGLDIAGLAGIMIGGALYRVPVVLDGMITAAAALVADRLVPGTKSYLIASHLSREPVTEAIMKELDLHPVIFADLALGEGTGAAMLFPLLDMALAVYRQGDSFEQVKIEAYRRY